MKFLIKMTIWCVMALTVSVGFGPGAARASEESELQGVRQQLDTETTARSSSGHAEVLAKQFKVEVGTVEQLRASKQGWGEITIRMGLAQELVKTDPKTYPTMTEALQKVGDLRAQGSGWGVIAKELGFKLGPVISEVKHARNEMRAEMRQVEHERGAKRGMDSDRAKLERGNKSDRMERAEHMEKPERMEKAERPERPERPQRPERPERPERAGK